MKFVNYGQIFKQLLWNSYKNDPTTKSINNYHDKVSTVYRVFL